MGQGLTSGLFTRRLPKGCVAFTNIPGGERKTNILELEYEDSELIEMTLRGSFLSISITPQSLKNS